MENAVLKREELHESQIWKFPEIFRKIKGYRDLEKKVEEFNYDTSRYFMFSTKSLSQKRKKIIIPDLETSNHSLSKSNEKKKKLKQNKILKMLYLQHQQHLKLNRQNKSPDKSEKFFLTESKDYNPIKNKTVFNKTQLSTINYKKHDSISIDNSSLNNSKYKEYLMLSGTKTPIKKKKFLPKIFKEEIKNIKNDINHINNTISRNKITPKDSYLKAKIDHYLWRYGKSELDKFFTEIKTNSKSNRTIKNNVIMLKKDENILNLVANLKNNNNKDEESDDKLFIKNNVNKNIKKRIKTDREIYINKMIKFEQKYKDIVNRQKKEKKQRKIIKDLLDENYINSKKIKNSVKNLTRQPTSLDKL